MDDSSFSEGKIGSSVLIMSNGNMDLLAQAITQRPPQSPKTPPIIPHNSADNARRPDASHSPPPVTTGDSRTTARRNNILTQIQNLETDFAKKKDRYFHEQLRQLQEDLSRLHDGTHADFNSGVTDLMDIRNESLYIAREEGLHKLRVAEEDYAKELAAANEEFETTRATLKNDLLAHLQNKRKRIESDKSLSDISLSTTLEAPPSPSLHHTTGSRKLRHRVPVINHVTATYPPTQLASKSALDEVLEGLAETIKARHLKPTQQPQNEDRVRDRIEREREKLVRTMLVGVAQAEADADLSEMKKKVTEKGKKGGSVSVSVGTAVSASHSGHGGGSGKKVKT